MSDRLKEWTAFLVGLLAGAGAGALVGNWAGHNAEHASAVRAGVASWEPEPSTGNPVFTYKTGK